MKLWCITFSSLGKAELNFLAHKRQVTSVSKESKQANMFDPIWTSSNHVANLEPSVPRYFPVICSELSIKGQLSRNSWNIVALLKHKYLWELELMEQHRVILINYNINMWVTLEIDRFDLQIGLQSKMTVDSRRVCIIKFSGTHVTRSFISNVEWYKQGEIALAVRPD